MAVVNLTKRFCDTVRVASGRIEIRDAKVRGLELRVTSNGSKTWVIRYRRASDGTKRSLVLGHYPETSLAEARMSASDARREVDRGSDPAEVKAVEKKAPTFREVAADWQTDYALTNRSERVRADDQSVLERYIFPFIGEMKVHAVQRRDISRMLSAAKAATDGRRGHTKANRPQRPLTHRPNKVHEVTRTIFRWAVGEGILVGDPMAGMKRPIKRELPRDRVLAADEIKELWDSLRKASTKTQRSQGLPISRPTALAMLMSLTTGQRIGETSCIAISELEFGDSPTWTVPRERTKNREPHRVPLSRLALGLISEARTIAGQDSIWLFPNPDGSGPIDPHAATRALARARPLMGVRNFRVHDLRRTAATRMEELGIPPHVIAHVLNHISVRTRSVTSRVYARYNYDPEKRGALNQWGEALEKIISSSDRAFSGDYDFGDKQHHFEVTSA